jgi:hypothetical protein
VVYKAVFPLFPNEFTRKLDSFNRTSMSGTQANARDKNMQVGFEFEVSAEGMEHSGYTDLSLIPATRPILQGTCTDRSQGR